MTLTVLLFPLFGPTPYRTFVAITCGLVPGLAGAAGLFVGLRQHDLGKYWIALTAFSAPLITLPLLACSFVYLMAPA